MKATITTWDQLTPTDIWKSAVDELRTRYSVGEPNEFERSEIITQPVITTTGAIEDSKETKGELLPVNRIYPHVYDENIQAGQVHISLQAAISDTREALNAIGVPDLQAISSRLTNVAAAMKRAHLLTDFNESLGGVVSYIRRAALATPIDDVDRSALNSLLQVLQAMEANPMLDLDDAADLVDKLANEGWRGEHDLANELIKSLFSDCEEVPEDLQSLLFEYSETGAV